MTELIGENVASAVDHLRINRANFELVRILRVIWIPTKDLHSRQLERNLGILTSALSIVSKP
ncbi:hypothetical protein ANCCAN_10499 [Ancylostoma caninum]|uniref:Uncharacterized protein n=1 Tax=Ancylostoma caninum TaxID=29170 RepID=A0A368GGL8_ANCCA|nr:hypothetical protein ANCCAN_10499 [Ancylostoma caninum]